MNERQARRTAMLLSLLSYLSHHKQVSLGVLARMFRVSEREMERTLLSELMVCGVPPYSPTDYITVFINDGPNGKTVSLQQRAEFRRPLRLTAVEALALRTAIASHARGLPACARPVVEGLLDKIGLALGEENADGYQSFSVCRLTERMSVLLEDLDAAIASSSISEIEYFSAQHQRLERRRIWPLALFEEGSHFYVRAWCELRAAERTFRLDRLKSAVVLDEIFNYRPKRMKERATPGWDGTRPKGTMTVRFEPFVADDVEHEWVGRWRQARRTRDGSLVLTLPLYSEAWALGWVLSFGQYAELLAPVSLRKQLIARVKSMLRTALG